MNLRKLLFTAITMISVGYDIFISVTVKLINNVMKFMVWCKLVINLHKVDNTSGGLISSNNQFFYSSLVIILVFESKSLTKLEHHCLVVKVPINITVCRLLTTVLNTYSGRQLNHSGFSS